MARSLLGVVSPRFVLHPYSKHGKYRFYASMEMATSHKDVVRNNPFSNLDSTQKKSAEINSLVFVEEKRC